MSESIIVALITGGLSLVGTVFAVVKTSSKTQEEIRKYQMATDEKITDLRQALIRGQYI